MELFPKRQSRVEKTKNWFDKYEFGAILLGRMTPSIRPFAPFFVGTFKLNYKRFLIFDLIACSIWALGLVLLVVLWEYIANFFNMLQILSLVLLVILIVLLIYYFFTEKTGGFLKNFLIKFSALLLTIACVYLFIRLVMRFLI